MAEGLQRLSLPLTHKVWCCPGIMLRINPQVLCECEHWSVYLFSVAWFCESSEKRKKTHMALPQCFGLISLCSSATVGARWHINAIRVMAVSQWRSASTTQTNREGEKQRDSKQAREPGRQAQMKQIKWQGSMAEFNTASVQGPPPPPTPKNGLAIKNTCISDLHGSV